MINFTKAFDLAWERMEVLLFRPFDLGKWFVIGFSAFLAGMLAGGNGYNGEYNWLFTSPLSTESTSYSSYNYGYGYSSQLHNYTYHYQSDFSGLLQTEFGLVVEVMSAMVALGLVLLLTWLGARGQFLLLDNLVRNRGAIAWPWRTYERLGNGLCVSYFLITLTFLILFFPLGTVGFFVLNPLFQQHRWPMGGEIPLVTVYGAVCFLLVFGCTSLIFLYRELGVPLMFRNGLTARAAFGATLKLIREHTWVIFLFLLLRIALYVALGIVCCIVCCFSGCIYVLPYLGTVLILPAILFTKCFTLNFLAQFGPEYDVWTVDVVAAPPAAPDAPMAPAP